MKRMRFRLAVAGLVVLAAAIAAATAGAGSGGSLRIEPSWYDGRQISFLQPSLFSAKPNGGVLGCFGLGPDLAGIKRPTSPLYVIFDPTATQDHCDGDATAFRHDHVLSVAPGDPGYTGAWTLVLLVEASPGSIDLASHPFTAARDVTAAIANGTLVDVTSVFSPDAPPTMVAPVIGGS
jgi:opacity protein-like surface antigen